MTIVLQTAEPRLPAQPWAVGAGLVYWLIVRPSLRHTFNRVLLDPGPAAAILTQPEPVLCYVSHAAWWDGYLAFELFRRAYPRQHFLMMEEAQLRRYFFFRWCGCFSVDRQDAREGIRSLRYAAQLLTTHQKPLLWLFPQGMIVPVDRRPLALYRGAAEIATRTGGVWCVPVALRYEFGPEQRPDALVAMGEPLWVSQDDHARDVHETFTERLAATADHLHERWNTSDLAAFQPILRGKSSTNRIFDAVLGPLVRWWQQR